MNFSLYLFANDLLFAVHFVFILDHGNDVRHKAHLRFSYLNSKWVVKAVETTHNINNTFDLWPANKRTVPKFCRDEHLKKSEGVAVGSWRQLRASLKLILLEPRDKLSKNSTATILQLFSIWSKLERWKKLSGCLMCRSEIKKWLFRSVIFTYSTKQQWTISWLDCDMWQKVDCIQLVMASSVGGLRSSKALPKTKLAPKKGHGHC